MAPKDRKSPRQRGPLLTAFARAGTRQHVLRISLQAVEPPLRCVADVQAARTTTLPHAFRGIFRRHEMTPLCTALALPTEAAKRHVPLLLHAKPSMVLPREWQSVSTPEVLQASQEPTTLHARYGVSLADQLNGIRGEPPYAPDLCAALDSGVETETCWLLGWKRLLEAKPFLPLYDLRKARRAYRMTGSITTVDVHHLT